MPYLRRVYTAPADLEDLVLIGVVHHLEEGRPFGDRLVVLALRTQKHGHEWTYAMHVWMLLDCVAH